MKVFVSKIEKERKSKTVVKGKLRLKHGNILMIFSLDFVCSLS